jgi:hypothetical protein
VQEAIRAVNRQIADDFAPYWSMAATLRPRVALRRLELKRAYGGGRRSVRYRRFTAAAQPPAAGAAAVAQALETPAFVPVPEGVRIVRSENA